jgi:dihydrofolate synthase/folylpolyglutamate synthase
VSWEQASQHLDALGTDVMKSMRPNTARIEALCEALNHPERAVPAIHITGTNGKTSTARIAASLLAAAGLTVGTYTSPHLQSVRERIALNGEPLPESAFGDVFSHLKPYLDMVEKDLEERLTYFEVLTAMFFLWAAEAPVEAMVVEVGLGGTWDATNVVPAPVAVITNVGLDHTGLLGTDREQIAGEKAGIVKQGSTVVTAETTPAILEVISARAEQSNATVVASGRDFFVRDNHIAVGGRYLSVESSDRSYNGLFLPLHGSHQGVNAAVAIEATRRFTNKPLDQDVVAEGLMNVQVPGRLETVRLEGQAAVPVVVDVAHNPDGVSALVAGLADAFTFERVIFVVGVLADKDYRGMLSELARLPCEVIATRPRHVPSVATEQLRVAAEELGLRCSAIEDVAAAVDAALRQAQGGDLVCVMGSHYVVGEARPHLFASRSLPR